MNSETDDGANPLSARHVMVVAAHPDDETIGAGASIAEARRATLVHVTDGAESLQRAFRKGFASRAIYAGARRAELQRAFASLPIETNLVTLGVHDQYAAFHIAEIANALRRLFLDHKPDVILTHAFEGGHPDHDATAMAAHLAWRSLDMPVPLYEMTGYNSATGRDVYGEFIPRTDARVVSLRLSAEARTRKAAMLAAFASQRAMIARFPLQTESFRPAPRYAFASSPHAGSLYYECHWLPMTGRRWSKLASRASQEFAEGASQPHDRDWVWHWMSFAQNLFTWH